MEGSKEQVELLLMYEEVKKQLDQYKTAHNKLTAGLKEAVAESIQYKHERDSLIKVVAKLREELKDMEDDYAMVNGNCMYWEDKFHEIDKKYTNLTEHIRLKALHNPSVSRYKDLMHFIDELEADTHD